MPRWMLALVVAFLVVFGATVLLTGQPEYLIPVAILASLVVGYSLFQRALTRKIVRDEGSLEAARSDSEQPIPSAHLLGADDTDVGDTPEAHDEITAHDLPLDNPGRAAVAARTEGEAGTTQGDRDRLDVAPARPADKRPSGLR
jgi:hypothetical protein